MLYEIDPREYEIKVAKAEADSQRAKAQRELANAELTKMKRLRSTNAVSESEIAQSIAASATAEAEMMGMKAALDLAKLELSHTRITAPIDGRVSRSLLSVGNLILAQEGVTLTTIVKSDPIYVSFDMSEGDFIALAANENRKPTEINLSLDSGLTFPYPGVINFREFQADPKTRTVRVRGNLTNPEQRLIPDLTCQVRIASGKSEKSLFIPESAILTQKSGSSVVVAESPTRMITRKITTGARIGKLIAVETGLKAEDWIVVDASVAGRFSEFKVVPTLP